MHFKASDRGILLNGKGEGNPDIEITELAKIEEAKQGSISFIANPKYIPFAYNTEASALVVDEKIEFKEKVSATLIRVQDPYAGFVKLLEVFGNSKEELSGIEEPSLVSKSAKLGTNVFIGAFSYVGDNVEVGDSAKIYPQVYLGDNVKIGKNTVLYAGVKVYSECQIGNDCIVHSGVIIGSDGFGFIEQLNDSRDKVPQVGRVRIEDDVEIGANTTIDRATLGETIIEKGVKIDNLVQIAHNVEIGADSVIAALTGISGSTKLGKGCIVGGQVGMAGHLTIADGTKINGKSGVAKSVKKKGTALNGIPAFEYSKSLRAQAVFRRLPEIEKKIDDIDKRLFELDKASR